jgi:hypothetical protein
VFVGAGSLWPEKWPSFLENLASIFSQSERIEIGQGALWKFWFWVSFVSIAAHSNGFLNYWVNKIKRLLITFLYNIRGCKPILQAK